MKIVLLTGESECKKCRKAKEILGRIADGCPSVTWQTLQSEDPEAAVYGIVMTPTVVVGDTIIASGRPPNEKKLRAYIEATAKERQD